MAQQLRILQSLWAMERRADEAEWPLETQLNMIRDAGFDAPASASLTRVCTEKPYPS
jgi:hypothetical protein